MIYEGKQTPRLAAKIAVVVAKFNRTITERLLKGALDKFQELGVEQDMVDVFYVPGAFEIPMVISRLLETQLYEGFLALGAVIKGETSHDEHINRAVSLQLSKLSCDSQVPVMYGVLTCNTVEQAIARSGGDPGSHDKTKAAHLGNKGADCAEGLLEMMDLIGQIDQIENEWDDAVWGSGVGGGFLDDNGEEMDGSDFETDSEAE